MFTVCSFRGRICPEWGFPLCIPNLMELKIIHSSDKLEVFPYMTLDSITLADWKITPLGLKAKIIYAHIIFSLHNFFFLPQWVTFYPFNNFGAFCRKYILSVDPDLQWENTFNVNLRRIGFYWIHLITHISAPWRYYWKILLEVFVPKWNPVLGIRPSVLSSECVVFLWLCDQTIGLSVISVMSIKEVTLLHDCCVWQTNQLVISCHLHCCSDCKLKRVLCVCVCVSRAVFCKPLSS